MLLAFPLLLVLPLSGVNKLAASFAQVSLEHAVSSALTTEEVV